MHPFKDTIWWLYLALLYSLKCLQFILVFVYEFHGKMLTSDLHLSPVPSATDDANSTLVAVAINPAGAERFDWFDNNCSTHRI